MHVYFVFQAKSCWCFIISAHLFFITGIWKRYGSAKSCLFLYFRERFGGAELRDNSATVPAPGLRGYERDRSPTNLQSRRELPQQLMNEQNNKMSHNNPTFAVVTTAVGC